MRLHRSAFAALTAAVPLVLLPAAPAVAEHDEDNPAVTSLTIVSVTLDRDRQMHVLLVAECTSGEDIYFLAGATQRAGGRQEAQGYNGHGVNDECASGTASATVPVTAEEGRFRPGWTSVRATADVSNNVPVVASTSIKVKWGPAR